MDIDAVSISDLFGISKSIFFFPTWTSNLEYYTPTGAKSIVRDLDA